MKFLRWCWRSAEAAAHRNLVALCYTFGHATSLTGSVILRYGKTCSNTGAHAGRMCRIIRFIRRRGSDTTGSRSKLRIPCTTLVRIRIRREEGGGEEGGGRADKLKRIALGRKSKHESCGNSANFWFKNKMYARKWKKLIGLSKERSTAIDFK